MPAMPPRPHAGERGSKLAIPTLATLGLVAFGLGAGLTEGAARGWAIIYLRDVFDVSAFIESLALPALLAAMAGGRLVADRFIERFGPVRVARTLSEVCAHVAGQRPLPKAVADTTAVVPALAGAGFKDVEVFAPHAEPSPDFPNVPGHVSNPENPQVFAPLIERAKIAGHDLILATDPDCDRVGLAVPLAAERGAPWTTLTGNQIGALLADYLLEFGKVAGVLTPDHYVVKTLVTTELIRRVADYYGVRTIGNLLVGFKWIGGVMEQENPGKFILGAEESYGFLVGDHARDKDAAVAAMLLAELAARLKAKGQTPAEKLDELFRRHGCHVERTISVAMPGAEGMDRMKEVMKGFRSSPPKELAGLKIAAVRDYQAEAAATLYQYAEAEKPLTGDVVMLDLAEEGNTVAVRPSGTEPKVKFYMFAYAPPAESRNPAAARAVLESRLEAIEADLRKFSGVQQGSP